MQDLIKQEQFEIEVLDKLNSAKLLHPLIFVGGTMLRLCYGLNRYSVDLDFWFYKQVSIKKYYKKMFDVLNTEYYIKYSAEKYYTILFEIKSKNYPRSLKLELRKKDYKTNSQKIDFEKNRYEENIAYSKYSNLQVLVKTFSLNDMLKFKIETFLSRNEIRNCFDIEFILKKGIKLDINKSTAQKLITQINSFTNKDFTVKLGSLLDTPERNYYIKNRFKLLKIQLQETLVIK